MERGTVKWFDLEKGFGFIQSDGADKKEFFVHKTSIEEGGSLDQGERVEFEIGEGKKGPMAVNVRSLSESET